MQENSQEYHQLQLMQYMQEKSRKSRKQIAYIIAGLIFFVFALYILFSVLIPKVGIKLISVNSEIKMGNQLFNGLQEEIKIDQNASAILQNFADQLHLSKDYPIRVSVAVSDEINAYALPGGHIVVNSAILRELKTPESLVALLCHETTHINRRHSMQNILSSMGTGFVISMFTNGGGSAAKVVVDNANFLLQMKYSRTLEMQADTEGMRLMERNKIDPKGMMELMQTLKQTEEDGTLQSLSFFRSHPLTDERIGDARNYIQSHHFTEQTMNALLLDYWNQIKFVVKDSDAPSDDTNN
jgi:predicted Zn-dependent protease